MFESLARRRARAVELRTLASVLAALETLFLSWTETANASTTLVSGVGSAALFGNSCPGAIPFLSSRLWGLSPLFEAAGSYTREVSWPGGSWQSGLAIGNQATLPFSVPLRATWRFSPGEDVYRMAQFRVQYPKRRRESERGLLHCESSPISQVLTQRSTPAPFCRRYRRQ